MALGSGIGLNPDKCRICVSEVSYFGQKLTTDGLKPDTLKVKAIRDMPPPTSEAELETVLCMVNYLARFAPNLVDVCTKLKWDTTHENASQKMKETMTAKPRPVLAYFDPEKEVTLQTTTTKLHPN